MLAGLYSVVNGHVHILPAKADACAYTVHSFSVTFLIVSMTVCTHYSENVTQIRLPSTNVLRYSNPSIHPPTVVIWSDLLGGVYMWWSALCWSTSHYSM